MDPLAAEISILAEPPHSIASAKVDDKGRLKLPSESLEWCKKSNVLSVFVTTLDKESVRIYPIPVWKSTINVLEAAGEHAGLGAKMALIAKVFGGDAEIDQQGRILLPSALRTLLGLESQPVFLEHVKGRIELTTKAVFDKKLASAESDLGSAVETFQKLGL